MVRTSVVVDLCDEVDVADLHHDTWRVDIGGDDVATLYAHSATPYRETREHNTTSHEQERNKEHTPTQHEDTNTHTAQSKQQDCTQTSKQYEHAPSRLVTKLQKGAGIVLLFVVCLVLVAAYGHDCKSGALGRCVRRYELRSW